MLVDCICGVWHGGGCAARENIGVRDQLNYVRSMATTGSFNVVNVNTAVFENFGGVLEEASLIKTVGVNVALDILRFADAAIVSKFL